MASILFQGPFKRPLKHIAYNVHQWILSGNRAEKEVVVCYALKKMGCHDVCDLKYREFCTELDGIGRCWKQKRPAPG